MTDSTRPHDLRVNHLRAPLGIGRDPLRVSWKLPGQAGVQHAYRIVADDWDTGRVESGESLFVPVDVPPRSGRRVEWRVKTWTDVGESDWSETSWWEHGLLDAADWTARWIAPIEGDDLPPRQRPAHQLGRRRPRSTARCAERGCTPPPTASTRRSSTARRVGDLELTPGLDRLPLAPPGADLRRHRPARPPATTSSARCSATAGGAARTASPAGSTTTAPPPRSSPQLESPSPTATTDRLRHRRHLAVDAEPHPRRRPHRRRGPRPPPTARLGRLAGLGRPSGSRTTATTRSSPRRRHRCGGSRSCGRRRSAELGARPVGRRRRPEHQRLGPARAASAPRAPRSPSPTASGSTTTATSPRSTSSPGSIAGRRSTCRSRPTW